MEKEMKLDSTLTFDQVIDKYIENMNFKIILIID